MARNRIPLPAIGNVVCCTCRVLVGSLSVPFIHVGSNVRIFGAAIHFDRAPHNARGGSGLGNTCACGFILGMQFDMCRYFNISSSTLGVSSAIFPRASGTIRTTFFLPLHNSSCPCVVHRVFEPLHDGIDISMRRYSFGAVVFH